jgi:ParB family chromosome partitioning protein
MEKNIQEIPIEDIIPNRFQPRLTFNEQGINELSDSIKQHGIIQPLVVRKLGDKYEIIAGERRYKAATQAGLTKVPVVISDIDDNKSAEVALVENIQRRNLTAIEEAKSYKNLLDRGYLTQEQLASKMGVSQSAIANKLRLLNLDPEVQDALLNEKISERHARALLTLEDKEEQRKWLKKILDERLTVRQLDMELKKLRDGDTDEEDINIPLVNINPDIDNILNNAEDINTVRDTHDVASMLIPENEPINTVAQPEPIDNLDTELTKEPTTTTIPNKFFNFLEDEKANMDLEESDEIFNTFIPNEEEPIKNVELLDDLDNIENTNLQNSIDSEKIEEKVPEEDSISSLQSMFFSNVSNNTNSTTDSIEEDIPLNPVLEEQIETPSEEVPNSLEKPDELIIDPMDSVIKLEPDYEEKVEETAGIDLKTAISKIRETIDELTKKGFIIDVDEADLDNLYNITIKINK